MILSLVRDCKTSLCDNQQSRKGLSSSQETSHHKTTLTLSPAGGKLDLETRVYSLVLSLQGKIEAHQSGTAHNQKVRASRGRVSVRAVCVRMAPWKGDKSH